MSSAISTATSLSTTMDVVNTSGQRFYCSARRRMLTIGTCIADYVDANARERRRASCYRCIQGRAVRQAYAEGELTNAWPTPAAPQLTGRRRTRGDGAAAPCLARSGGQVGG